MLIIYGNKNNKNNTKKLIQHNKYTCLRCNVRTIICVYIIIPTKTRLRPPCFFVLCMDKN